MNMRQRNSAKPKPKLQVYVSRDVADRLRDYASNVGCPHRLPQKWRCGHTSIWRE